MAAIYTTEWYEELKELLNHNPDVVKNAPPGTYRVLAEVSGDATSPYLAKGQQRLFVVLLVDGKCTEYSEVSEAPPRKEFDFIFDLPATIFEGVAAGVVDPVDAGLKGTIKITGDITKMAAQVPALFETLSGMPLGELLGKVRRIGDKAPKPEEK